MSTNDLILQWSIAVLVGLVLHVRGRLTLFHPVAAYLAFHVVAFCLRPTLIAAFELESIWKSMLLTPEPAHLRLALHVSSAGLVAFAAAFLAGTSRAAPLREARPPELDRSDRRALLVAAAIFAVPGVAAASVALTAREVSGYTRDIPVMLLGLSLPVILAAPWRWWSLLPLVAITWYFAATGPALGAVVQSLFLLLLVWLWSHQRRRPSLFLIAVAAALAFGALFFGDGRAMLADWVDGRESPGTPGARSSTLIERIDRPEFAHFDALTYGLAVVPEESGAYSHGSQYLAPLHDVSGSPAGDGSGAPATIDLQRYGQFAGMPMALVLDGWVSGGWVGLVITLAVAGLLLGFAFSFFARRQDDRAAACCFFLVHAMALGLYSGGSLALVHRTLYAAAPLLTWQVLARRFRRSEAATAERERLREERQRRRTLGVAILHPNAAPIPPEALAADPVDTEDETLTSSADESGDANPNSPVDAGRPIEDIGPTASRPTARWHEDRSP